MRVYLIGYPGRVGGASTEAGHLVRLWRRYGVEVHLVPTWTADAGIRADMDALGCVTHDATPECLGGVEGLRGSVVVGMCNKHCTAAWPALRRLGCRIAWVNCMTMLLQHERETFRKLGPPDVMVYHTRYQEAQIAPAMRRYGKPPSRIIRGAFDADSLAFDPRPHFAGSEFVVGRMARGDGDKWSKATWQIYGRIPDPKRVLLMGMSPPVRRRLGEPPPWAECHEPGAVPVGHFLTRLHCLLPINGGARENWPRVGLEAMAAGVPIVTQKQWGWLEMIEHGVTGFLASSDRDLARWATELSRDETLRLQIAEAARERLVRKLAAPEPIWEAWREVFETLGA